MSEEMKLRKSARFAPHCMSCGMANPNANMLCLAHANTLRSGKGMGIKGSARYGAIVCDTCHSLIDGRINTYGRTERQEMLERANAKTVAWWIQTGALAKELA